MPVAPSETVFREFAPAKINLTLVVKGRRPDGFHELQSLVTFADCGDVLTGKSASAMGLDVTGPFAPALDSEKNNLVMKAAQLLVDHLGIKQAARLVLEKNLPVASGIGGGSADAAAALRLLRALSGCTVESHAMAALALCIGADVPVCLEATPAFMWGKGELMMRLDSVPQFWFVLVNPGIAVSTAQVFAALAAPLLMDKELAPRLPSWANLDQFVDWLEGQGNDLEKPALSFAPVISEVIASLASAQGCRLARMSGSGATCFGIFADEATARAAETALHVAHPEWWVRAAQRL